MFVLRLGISVFLGLFLGLTNLYVALKLGFTVGVAILTIFCWGGFDTVIRSLFRTWVPLSPRDYACAQSLSSAMSYGSGTVIATALAAYLMSIEGFPPTWILVLWLSSICGLGTLMALPLRNTMLEHYPFPSGTAAAETVHQVARGQRIRTFFAWLAGCGLVVLARDLWKWIPQTVPPGSRIFAVQPSPMLIGLGAILGVRVCGSMVLGGFVFLVLAPHLGSDAAATEQNIIWFAVSAMLSSALLDFFLSHRGNLTQGTWSLAQVPKRRYWTAFVVFCLIIWGTSVFGLGGSVWCVVAFFLLPLFSLISCRVTGETDMVPTGALGKTALLLFGILHLGSPQSHMISTGVLAGTSAASADFMTDLRCGKNLECPVKPQFGYQLTGALLGPVFFVPLLVFLVRDRFPLGGAEFPAPAAQIWLNVLEFTQMGWSGLHGPLRWILPCGLACGAVLTLIGRHPNLKNRFLLPVPFAFAALLDMPTVLTLLLGAGIAWKVPMTRGFTVWCAMIAAESAIALILMGFA